MRYLFLKKLKKEYLQYHHDYTKKYGKKTIIFLQAGSFFELYATYNDKQEYVGCDMSVVIDILNIQVTRKNKKIKESELLDILACHCHQ